MVIEEKYSRYWVQITIALGLGTLLFLVGYSLVQDLYWRGMMRVVAFGFLSATVFGGLKVIQGKHTIEITEDEGNLILTYRKNGRDISRDVFALSQISELQYQQHAPFLGITFVNDLNLRFSPADSDQTMNLVEVNGRALALTTEDARKVTEFVRAHAPEVTISESPQ